jgi:glutamate synthase domain-containing protein 2
VLAICKAMQEIGTAPDFIIVDGSAGGTGAAPAEFEDNVGMPLTQGLMTLHNALVGTGLRDRVRIGASGRVATGSDIVRRLIQGADYTNAGRPMMMALGCIQALRCASNKCPTGIATQNPRLQRSLDVPSRIARVANYQRNTVAEALRLLASMGAATGAELSPQMLQRNLGEERSASYAELYRWLEPGELLAQAPQEWATDWQCADPQRFGLSASVH